MKIARVIALFKSGNKKLVDNYRGISILPLLSKIFEKVGHGQLTQFLTKYNLILESQFGFRRGVSTSHAVINTLQFVYDNLDKGNVVISLFLDFAKAFDCVSHDILLEKLYIHSVRGIASDWFRSYLTDRIESNMCLLIAPNLVYVQLVAVYHRVQYLGLSCFLYIYK